jgi:DNA-directed RNA polymerase
MQHLQGLLKDEDLAKKVYLIVDDQNGGEEFALYESLVTPINTALNEVGNRLECENVSDLYRNLRDVVVTRSLIKLAVMTKVYLVTVMGVVEQLQSSLEKIEKVHLPKNDNKSKQKTIIT